ncbi:MAG: ferritin family protein [Desulfuromonadales bacterium]
MRGLLVNCQKIEEIASKIYRKLAGESTYANEVRKVFQKLTDDEKSHARNFDVLLQANEKEIDATHTMAWEKVNASLQLAESLLRKVETVKLNEEKALRLAVDMEQQFVKVHVHNALFFRDQKLADLFNKLGSEDEAHLNTLKECLTWWHAERKQIMQGH